MPARCPRCGCLTCACARPDIGQRPRSSPHVLAKIMQAIRTAEAVASIDIGAADRANIQREIGRYWKSELDIRIVIALIALLDCP